MAHQPYHPAYSWGQGSGDPRLDEALWAYWTHDYKHAYSILTQICMDEIKEGADVDVSAQESAA